MSAGLLSSNEPFKCHYCRDVCLCVCVCVCVCVYDHYIYKAHSCLVIFSYNEKLPAFTLSDAAGVTIFSF